MHPEEASIFRSNPLEKLTEEALEKVRGKPLPLQPIRVLIETLKKIHRNQRVPIDEKD